jgi:hypothetical protein
MSGPKPSHRLTWRQRLAPYAADLPMALILAALILPVFFR